VDGKEEYKRPEQSELPDVQGAVEVVGLITVNREWPVEGGKCGDDVIERFGVDEAGTAKFCTALMG